MARHFFKSEDATNSSLHQPEKLPPPITRPSSVGAVVISELILRPSLTPLPPRVPRTLCLIPLIIRSPIPGLHSYSPATAASTPSKRHSIASVCFQATQNRILFVIGPWPKRRRSMVRESTASYGKGFSPWPESCPRSSPTAFYRFRFPRIWQFR